MRYNKKRLLEFDGLLGKNVIEKRRTAMKEKKKRRIWRSIGSLVFTAIGFVVIPALIDKCSNMLYNPLLKKN